MRLKLVFNTENPLIRPGKSATFCDVRGARRVEGGERYDCRREGSLAALNSSPFRRHLTPSWVLAEAPCCLVLPSVSTRAPALSHTVAPNLNQHPSSQDTLWPSPMRHACGCRLTICGSRFGKRVRLRLPLRACPCAPPTFNPAASKGTHTLEGPGVRTGVTWCARAWVASDMCVQGPRLPGSSLLSACAPPASPRPPLA